MADAKLLILIDPTRGVDVGARAEIKRVWAELRAAGRAMLIASTDIEELVDVCDRVIVFRRGRIVGELPRAELSEERLLKMAADV
jgi:ABC-type sugar transport system ATPase subunit